MTDKNMKPQDFYFSKPLENLDTSGGVLVVITPKKLYDKQRKCDDENTTTQVISNLLPLKCRNFGSTFVTTKPITSEKLEELLLKEGFVINENLTKDVLKRYNIPIRVVEGARKYYEEVETTHKERVGKFNAQEYYFSTPVITKGHGIHHIDATTVLITPKEPFDEDGSFDPDCEAYRRLLAYLLEEEKFSDITDCVFLSDLSPEEAKKFLQKRGFIHNPKLDK